MNDANKDILKSKRRTSNSDGTGVTYDGPGDVTASAKDYNSVVIYTDVSIIDANTQITRVVEDSWNGESYFVLSSDAITTVGITRTTQTVFGGFLRVRHEVKATSGNTTVGASFQSGITYKQT